MTKKKISGFVFGHGGAVSLQITTLITLLVAVWNLSAWKSDMEYKVEESTKSRWTAGNMVEWSGKLAIHNGELTVPDVWEVAKHNAAIE